MSCCYCTCSRGCRRAGPARREASRRTDQPILPGIDFVSLAHLLSRRAKKVGVIKEVQRKWVADTVVSIHQLSPALDPVDRQTESFLELKADICHTNNQNH